MGAAPAAEDHGERLGHSASPLQARADGEGGIRMTRRNWPRAADIGSGELL